MFSLSCSRVASAVGAAVAAAVIGVSAAAVAVAGPSSNAPGDDLPQRSTVEDRSYPGAAKILAERSISLKSGDGRILLVDCGSAPDLVEVYSRTKGTFCFKIIGATGYLALDLPETYTVKGNSHRLQVSLTAQGRTTTATVEKESWTPVGEGTGGAPSVLVEIRTL
ncbi:hypothetical protein GCM10009754_46830 [Amycolatopsis minnesotensis]|uniref:Secreted protein n=2 Tax=Amycolatopsis minnesotensis TaxID=337894 RepID=A0ABN2RGI3_9PSEU